MNPIFTHIVKGQSAVSLKGVFGIVKNNASPIASASRNLSAGPITLKAKASSPSMTKLFAQKKDEILKNRPKRPLNAYLLFTNELRPIITQQRPELSIQELTKLISQKWKSLSESEKAPYEERASQNSLNYQIIKAEFEKTLPPKKPSGPYIQFAIDIRPALKEEYPDLDFLEKSKITSSRWKTLDPSKKETYRQDYQEKYDQWKKSYSELLN